MEIQKINETKHSEMLSLLNPFLDFLTKNEFNFFLVVGKDSVCSRYAFGDNGDIAGMIKGMMETNKDVEKLITQIVENK